MFGIIYAISDIEMVSFAEAGGFELVMVFPPMAFRVH